MKKYILILILCSFISITFAQNPIGKWKYIAHYSSFDKKKTNMQEALFQTRPCTKNTVIDFLQDGKIVKAYSGCETKYVEMQQKLYKNQKWKIEGNSIKISVTNFSIYTTYTISFIGNKMTFENVDEKIVYQKL